MRIIRYIDKYKIDLAICLLIFTVALLIRVLYLSESAYFGFDEARDAFISQNIYLERDLKIIGPTAGNTGLHHGVLFWYFLGPLYLIAQGSPLIVSIFFRVFNSLGVFLIYYLGKVLFNRRTGIICGLIFAFSFEETQYAIFTGNPSLAILSWLLIFLGVSVIHKFPKKSFIGILLMSIGVSSSVQFELYSIYTIPLSLLLLFMFRKNLRVLKPIHWLIASCIFLLISSSFIIGELMYNFTNLKNGFNLIFSGFHVLDAGENKYSNYLKYLMLIFHDNIYSFTVKSLTSCVFTFGTIILLIFKAIREKSKSVLVIIIWILSGSLMLFTGGYNMYQMNVGIGLGLILGISVLLENISKKSILLCTLLLILILISNLNLILTNNINGLNVGIKAQPYMRLSDEIEIINRMYKQADGNQFTFRVTGMPYLVQTVWAYLFNQYGYKKYGYMPFLETGNVLGYPGIFPVPGNGLTCIRFYIREPMRGIPEKLSLEDIKTENYFSSVIMEENIGSFLLQYRQAFDKKNCI